MYHWYARGAVPEATTEKVAVEPTNAFCGAGCVVMVGAEVAAAEATQFARIAVLNALAAVAAEVGSLDRIVRIVKLVGFVASSPEFTGQPGVINGASELLGDIFGDAGKHARSAVGVAVLPLDAPVEIELIVEVA